MSVRWRPGGVIEVGSAGVRFEIVRRDLRAVRLAGGTRAFEVGRQDARVAVAPLAFHQRDTGVGAQIDGRKRRSVRRVGMRARRDRRRQQADDQEPNE